jgi:hypothetical protein
VSDETGKVLVLVTGTGRSGTSTMAGSLHHLGLSVPGPHLGANDSNPKGFYESRWAVRFHKRIIAAAGLDDFDGRPEAIDLAHRAETPALRARLVRYLERVTAGADRVVVKDPRSVWAQKLWLEVATELGITVCYVSMLRHPAEVVGSRTTYYASGKDEAGLLRYQTASIARWVNSSLVTERETRGQRRAFVGYADLIQDWRGALGAMAEHLGIPLDIDQPTAARRVDEFVDPALRRHTVGWDELDVPAALREVAEAVWTASVSLGRDGPSAVEPERFDALSADYARLYRESVAISHDTIAYVRREAVRRGAREERQRLEHDRQAAGPEDRAVREVSARDLLGVVGGRVVRRVRHR